MGNYDGERKQIKRGVAEARGNKAASPSFVTDKCDLFVLGLVRFYGSLNRSSK